MTEGLFDRRRSLLAVIDVQAGFLARIPAGERAGLTARIAWMMRAARALAIPIVVTAEEADEQGPPDPAIAAEMPAGMPVLDKVHFGMAGQHDIMAALRASGRDQAVLLGLETDVCVAQSALGLRAAGWTVAVATDGCAAPGPCHGAGLRRMEGAGVVIGSIKGLYYEWARDLATHSAVMAEIGRTLPPGLTL